MNSASSNQYEAALGQALSHERAARSSTETLRVRLANAEAEIARYADAVDALLRLLPPNRRAIYLEQLVAIRPPAKLNRGTTAYEAIVGLLDRVGPRQWTAPEVQDALLASGSSVEVEQVHNVLTYLCRKKRLTRTSRGHYVLIGEASMIVDTA